MRPMVKGSFFEGRETNVNWLDSESRKLEKDIETSNFNNRKVVQIDKDTGGIVNVFKNIRHAKHHAINVLGGNLHQFNLAVLSNWRCSGFEWDLLDINSRNNVTKYYNNADTRLYCIIERSSIRRNLTLSEVNDYMDLKYRFHPSTEIKSKNGKIVLNMVDYDERVDYGIYFKNEYPYVVKDFLKNTTTQYKSVTSIHRELNLPRHTIYKLINGISHRGMGNNATKKLFERYKITKEEH